MATTAAIDYVGAARALAPLIEAEADRIEDERALPAHLVDALIDAGIFRLLLPRSLGGIELDLPTHIRVVEELARADASVAWCVGQANGLLNYIAYADPSAARSVFEGDEPSWPTGLVKATGPGVPCLWTAAI